METTTYSDQEKRQIADTIREQIGNECFYMMGTKRFSYGEKDNKVFLQFNIMHGNDLKANTIKVFYDAALDLYNVEFCQIRKAKHEIKTKIIKSIEGIYSDQFHEIIEDYTGLRTSLF